MLAFLGRLSPHTSYSRFVTSAAPADVVDVHLLLANDACHRSVLALRGEEIVGHAQAVASPDQSTVELGVVVADERQGTGIGRRLVRALLKGGGPASVADDLEFFVLYWNTPARRMIKDLWPEAVANRDAQLIHYRVHTGAATQGSVRPATPAGVPARAEDQPPAPETLIQTNDKDVRPCSP